MTDEAKAAFVTAQAACAIIDALAILADGQLQTKRNTGEQIRRLKDEYLIGHNAVLEYLAS